MFSQMFRYPDGREYKFVLCGANTIPVWILPVTTDGKVIFLRHFRHPPLDFIIELPGGNPKPGQTYKDVAFAELAEETGYRPGRLQCLAEAPMWPDAAMTRLYGVAVLALDCTKVCRSKSDGTEVLETFMVPVREWFKACESGEVGCMRSLAVTLLARPHLAEYFS